MIVKKQCFYLPDNNDQFDFSEYDYVVDAIDTVTAKIDIISKCNQLNVPIISALGCGNRLDPTKLVVSDIFKTEGDPLAKVIRHELRKRNISKLKVVYSKEKPIPHKEEIDEELPKGKKDIPGSSAFVPPVAGIIIASEVIKDLIK
jgi:tRNA A37 threonylcarbamoyladenosine dehydratase